MKHHSGQDYIKAAQKNGLKVVSGKGDHVKVYGPNGEHICVPNHKQLATGTDHSIFKFFLSIGVTIAGLLWVVWRFQ
jgi:predicted RNA binding protein YcfA (HicA-like mRNA interferase family)